jgi:hypothetical protein
VLPNQVSFTGVVNSTALPNQVSFSGATNSMVMQSLVEFTNVQAIISMVKPITPSDFNGALPSGSMPTATPTFTGVANSTVLPNQVSFSGVTSSMLMQPPAEFTNIQVIALVAQPVMVSKFIGAQAGATLPEADYMAFDGIDMSKEVRIMFSDGNKIIPTYNVGAPLGAEKPLMEPKIKEDDKR